MVKYHIPLGNLKIKVHEIHKDSLEAHEYPSNSTFPNFYFTEIHLTD